jgi:copper homeostasis protein
MLEIIAETVADALAAETGGATQVELVTDLFEEGLTPSAGMIEQVCGRVRIGVLVMIRPHDRSSTYSQDDVAVMCSDIRTACRLGASGLMLGCVTADGRVDVEAARRFRDAAEGRPLHFHNVWHLARDQDAAIEDIIALGFQSMRTHGGRAVAGKAGDNAARIRRFAGLASGRIELYLAGGVQAQNVAELVRTTGVRNVHAGAAARVPPQRGGVVDAGRVRALAEALRQAEEGLANG